MQNLCQPEGDCDWLGTVKCLSYIYVSYVCNLRAYKSSIQPEIYLPAKQFIIINRGIASLYAIQSD